MRVFLGPMNINKAYLVMDGVYFDKFRHNYVFLTNINAEKRRETSKMRKIANIKIPRLKSRVLFHMGLKTKQNRVKISITRTKRPSQKRVGAFSCAYRYQSSCSTILYSSGCSFTRRSMASSL